MSTDLHRVLILGGGFAGLAAARALSRARRNDLEITLIDRNNYFLFVPLLHEVATGGVDESNVVMPLRQALPASKIAIVRAEVRAVDRGARRVATSAGDYGYDTLVLALGSEWNDFGVPGAREHAVPLKSLADARKVKKCLTCAYELAQVSSPDECQALLTFAIVGAGATGVELAGEIADLVQHEFRAAYPKVPPARVAVELLQRGDTILPEAAPKVRRYAEQTLKRLGVSIRTDACVTAVSREGIMCGEEVFIPTRNVFWTAGVKAGGWQFAGERSVQGRIPVTPALHMKDDSSVFVVGDLAAIADRQGRMYSQRAQFAVLQGAHAARNIIRQLESKTLLPFRAREKGYIVSIGQWRAAGTVFGFSGRGKFIWWLYRTVYLFQMPNTRKRVKVAADWTVNLFTPRDIAEL